MKKYISYLLLVFILSSCVKRESGRKTHILDEGWKFINEDIQNGEAPELNTLNWKQVKIPHDWAISGKFDESVDRQEVMVYEDGEMVPRLRTGRTGALPHIGVGWYRKNLNIPSALKRKRIHLEFDGAMSHAKIYLNGSFVGEWPYGYSSFGFDITPWVEFGGENVLAVRLENKPFSSRWYPGAGLYREVRMVTTEPVFIKQWGTFVTTPEIAEGKGKLSIQTSLMNYSDKEKDFELLTVILDGDKNQVSEKSTTLSIDSVTQITQEMTVPQPKLWSPETPVIYTAITHVIYKGTVLDSYESPFGFRFFEFTSDSGFFLNDRYTELKGVCLHHDLGPLGAAYHHASMKHRMKLLKEMGCNAIRTSHNPPAPGLLTLADEMGFLVIDEAFDEWKTGKVENGYHTLWDGWAEKDLVALIRRDRNHPSVIAWSIGNEIPDQNTPEGLDLCNFLIDICKREDPTRPVTAGFNQWEAAIRNGLAGAVDLAGWNYKPHIYKAVHKNYPHWKMYGAETASTVSSRGEYFFPAEMKVHYTRTPYHSSSFDLEFPRWATTPDREWAAQDSFLFIPGEFVWTGFDYLGEPTPYNAQWPSRSSYFGIIDLCGIPKDRYYLYQSRWSDKKVLHLLPHWNWEEGQVVSVHCYTNFDRAELFLNGESLGIRKKNPSKLYQKYRLVWDEVIFKPGELKVVALDKYGDPVREEIKNSAGNPHKLEIKADRIRLKADGEDLAFLTISIWDENGNLCPKADNLIDFSIEGPGKILAVGNGDPTSLESFVKPSRKAFNGKCMVIVQTKKEAGEIKLTAKSKGLRIQSANLISEL